MPRSTPAPRPNDDNTAPIQKLIRRNKIGPNNINSKWWVEEDDRIASSVFSIVSSIELLQLGRRNQNIAYARMYSSSFAGEMYGLYHSNVFASSLNPYTPYANQRLSFNVIKSCIDSAASKIGKNKPRPLFNTSGGDRSQQKRAQQLTKFLDGVFYESQTYKHAQSVFRDACVFGYGAIKVYIDDQNQIQVERLIPDEVIVDDVEGAYGTPQQMHHKRAVSRDKLIALFPKQSQQIQDAPKASIGVASVMTTADFVAVVESWHLPSSPKAKDGLHTICVNNALLFEEEYTLDRFPIILFRWCPRLTGFFGQGLAAELQAIQLEINRIVRTIQVAQHLMSNPRILVEASSKISIAQINNEIGNIIKYSGTPPQALNWQAIPQEIYEYLENLYQKAYEITGISQMSAQSMKPAGLNSGAAIREYQDVESERWVTVGQAWEDWFIEVSQMMIALARQLSDQVPNLWVKAPSKRQMERINWKDVELDEDDYVLRCDPVSSLPQTPAGRLQTIQELMQAGIITPERGRQLLDYPDLEQDTTLATAAYDHVQKVIDKILEDEQYTTPEPYDDLNLMISVAKASYNKARDADLPESTLQLLRQLIDESQTLLTPPTAAPMTPQGAPQAAPMPPPTSDLLPNAPAAA